MSNAKQTLDWMATYKADLSRPHVQKMIDGFMRSHLSRVPGQRVRQQVDGKTLGEFYSGLLTRSLETGEAYFLDREMLPVVIWAARSLDAEATFEADLWPSPSGFVLLDEPYILPDARRKAQVTKALLWHPMQQVVGQPGTAVVHLVDPADERDESSLMIIEQHGMSRNHLISLGGRLQVGHVDFIPHGHAVGPQEVDTSALEPDVYGLPPADRTENQQRFVLAFLLMLNQTITRAEREQVSAKHAARMAKRHLPSAVTVVRMRRIAGASRAEGESQVEWAHRWVVRGHWRNQPYKADGEWVHKRIWIAPFVKGPEDKPFLVTEKVYSLER